MSTTKKKIKSKTTKKERTFIIGESYKISSGDRLIYYGDISLFDKINKSGLYSKEEKLVIKKAIVKTNGNWMENLSYDELIQFKNMIPHKNKIKYPNTMYSINLKKFNLNDAKGIYFSGDKEYEIKLTRDDAIRKKTSKELIFKLIGNKYIDFKEEKFNIINSETLDIVSDNIVNYCIIK